MPPKRLNWNRRLTRSLKPAKGPVARILTLRDAAWMILEFPPFRQRRPDWIRVSELLEMAARTGVDADVAAATDELEQALHKEGWLGRDGPAKI
jgi:hypothetical protein